MRIYYLCDTPLYQHDAPSLHVLQVAENLQHIGCSVRLYVPSIVRVDKHNLEIVYIKSLRKYMSLFFQPLLFLILVKDILQQKPDVIYIRQAPFLILPFLLGCLFKIEIVIEVNGIQEEEMKYLINNKFYRSAIKLKVFFYTEKLTYRLAQHVICVTEGIKEYLKSKYHVHAHKITVIHNAVDTSKFKPMSLTEARRKLKLSQQEVYIGYVGGITKWQGLQFLVDAAEFLNGYKIMIIGDGDFKEGLSQYIKTKPYRNNIMLKNSISHTEVPLFLNAFDVCISYPTKIRSGVTSPFKVYEYLACGRPCVVSDIRGVGDLFADYCLVAKAEDPRSLASKINALVRDKNLGYQLAEKGKQFILNGHTWHSVALQLNKVFYEQKNY